MVSHLDLIDVADGMVKLHRTSFLHVRLLSGTSIHATRLSARGGSVCIPRCGRMGRARSTRPLGAASLLVSRAVVIEGGVLGPRLTEQPSSILHGRAKLHLGAFHAVLNGLRPASSPLVHVRRIRPRRALGGVRLHVSRSPNRVDSRTRRSRDANAIRVILEAALDSVPRG